MILVIFYKVLHPRAYRRKSKNEGYPSVTVLKDLFQRRNPTFIPFHISTICGRNRSPFHDR